MMRQLIFIPALLIAVYSCGQEQKAKPHYPAQVGDIDFDPTIDDPTFKLCDESNVFQYYNFSNGLQYKGEKIKIDEHFEKGLKAKGNEGDNGFITIRFIVNCHGKTGRFRVQEMDNSYSEKTFDKNLAQSLLTLTQQLDGWAIGEYEGKLYDYYQYLTFKIEKGNLTEIMP